MTTTQQLTAMLASAALASTLAFAQPTATLETKVATKDVAGRGFVFSQTPIARAKATIANGPMYASFEQITHTNSPSTFFYNVAAVGTTYQMPKATLTLETSSVNVNGTGRTYEVMGKLTAKAPFSPAIEIASDVGAVNGQYIGVSASKSAKLGSIDTNVQVSVGYNDHLARSISDWSHAQLDLSATKVVTPHLSIGAKVRLQKALNATFANTQSYQASATYKF